MESVIKVTTLTVTLNKHFKALKNINLELPAGKVIGFIGPSGAGKTTLLRSIVGRIRPTSGSIEVFGQPAGSAQLRSQVSYMTQELSVYTDLTVKENLEYFVAMLGLSGKTAKETIIDVLTQVDMLDKIDSLVTDLSSGQKQRVSLAAALMCSPKLLLLDEPTVGLDPVLRESLWQLFDQLAASGATLVVSSHSMDEAQRCDDLVLIREGSILAHSSPEQICQQTGSSSVTESFLKLVGGK